jgi:hypothetical protein
MHSIYLMYYDRFETATTSIQLSEHNIKHTVLVHGNTYKFKCIGNCGDIIDTLMPKGIQNNFNYALGMHNIGEWIIFMSDDIKNSYTYQSGKFIKSNVSVVLETLNKSIQIAEKIGVKLVGLNSTGNPFYSEKPYSKYGLVDGRCFAIKKTLFKFDDRISTIPDYYATIYHLNKYGGNLIYNHSYIDFERYKSGGLGTINERSNDKIKDVLLLKQLYPENVIIKNKKGEPQNSHIVIKKTKHENS